MTPLPPDFWTTPQPGDVEGFVIGMIVGFSLWFLYIYKHAPRWKPDLKSKLRFDTFFYVTAVAIVIPCMAIVMAVSMIIAFEMK